MSTQTTVVDACNWARKEAARNPKWSMNWSMVCDHATAVAYGSDHSVKNDHTGYATARLHWLGIPSTRRHHGDRNPPAGALLFWGVESTGDGHAALSLGNGLIASTDILGSGGYYVVPFGEIETRWHMPYLGWADPVFNFGWGNGIRLAPVSTIHPVPKPVVTPAPAHKAQMKYSIAQIAAVATKAGFSGVHLEWAVAVCLAESGGDWWSKNVNKDMHIYPNGVKRPSIDRGPWQINDYWHKEVTDAQAYDWDKAAAATYVISNHGTWWGAWSSYQNGSAAKFIPQVRAILAQTPLAHLPVTAPITIAKPLPKPPVVMASAPVGSPTPVVIVPSPVPLLDQHTPPAITAALVPASIPGKRNWLSVFILDILHFLHLR